MRLVLLISLAIFYHSGSAQVADIVQSAGIKNELHRISIGKIFFTSSAVASATLKQKDFLQSYTLTNNSDLFFVAFMGNSLTNYLHQLSPGIPADSLVKIGNYQFTLLVDDKQVYQSNLLPGAPYAAIQDSLTILNRAFLDNKNGSGSWSESFWNRFLRNGGDSVMTDGQHTLKMEIRPYLKTDSLRIGQLIAAGGITVKVSRNARIDLSKIRLNKLVPYDGFTISTEAFDELKLRELKAKINDGVFKKISSLIVIKNGRLLIEEYFNKETRNTLHDTRSVGKSISSTLTGIAIHDGFIKTEQEVLGDFYNLGSFENYSKKKEQTKLSELLTMSSGFNGNDDDNNSPGNEELMYLTADWVKFTLNLPFNHNKSPGEWQYFTAGVILLGDILNKKVKGGLEHYADEKLFKPLHITNYKWQYTPAKVPNTAGGLQMSALDFAKYGQLYHNRGRWNNKQIIPEEWVDKSLSRQKQIPGRTNEYYGYLFWNKTFIVGNQPYEAFYCAGNGGNYILTFKTLPLVVVITATAYGQPYAHSQVTKMLEEYILPSLIR